MKKAIYAIMMLVASLMAVSCQSDSEYAQQGSQPMVIKATAERVGGSVTRTQMEYGYDVLWNEGDEICTKGNGYVNNTFVLVSGAGTPHGTFECNSNTSLHGRNVELFYPSSMWYDGDLIWPANQTKTTVMPMYCHQVLTEDYLTFKSLGGILQIVFMKNFQATFDIKTVKVEDGEKTLSGAFTVDEEGKAVITATNKAGITLEANVENLGWGACIMNVALPAGTYNSLKLTFTDKYGRVFVKNVGEPVSIGLNGITKVKVAGGQFHDISPSTGIGTINGNQNKEVPWVRLWLNGPKFAAFNVGVGDYKPESYGVYYNWGGKIDRNGNTNSSCNTGSVTLSGTDDTATYYWGSEWRMPTRKEMEGLINNCIAQHTTQNGVDGVRFTGIGDYSQNSIFLPMADYIGTNQTSPNGLNSGNDTMYDGCYWTSDPDGNNRAYYLHLYFFTKKQAIESEARTCGQTIRAVLNE